MTYRVYKVVTRHNKDYCSFVVKGQSKLMYRIGATTKSTTPIFVFPDELAARKLMRGYPTAAILEGTTTKKPEQPSMWTVLDIELNNFTQKEIEEFWRMYHQGDNNEEVFLRFKDTQYLSWGSTLFVYDFTPVRPVVWYELTEEGLELRRTADGAVYSL